MHDVSITSARSPAFAPGFFKEDAAWNLGNRDREPEGRRSSFSA